jgi:hypothetical protein
MADNRKLKLLATVAAGALLCVAVGCSREGASAATTREAVAATPTQQATLAPIVSPSKSESFDETTAQGTAIEKPTAEAVVVAAAPEASRLQPVIVAIAGAAAVPAAGEEMIRDALTPPRQVEFPAVPFRDQPRSWLGIKLDPPPANVASLPSAVIRQQPQLIDADQQVTLRTLPARDTPPTGIAVNLTRPQKLELPSAPLAFARSVDPIRIPDLVAKLIPAASPTETSDVTATASRLVSLSLLPALRALPAPFLALTILDPFEATRTVRLRTPIPDTDSPATSQTRPERPVLK